MNTFVPTCLSCRIRAKQSSPAPGVTEWSCPKCGAVTGRAVDLGETAALQLLANSANTHHLDEDAKPEWLATIRGVIGTCPDPHICGGHGCKICAENRAVTDSAARDE